MYEPLTCVSNIFPFNIWPNISTCCILEVSLMVLFVPFCRFISWKRSLLVQRHVMYLWESWISWTSLWLLLSVFPLPSFSMDWQRSLLPQGYYSYLLHLLYNCWMGCVQAVSDIKVLFVPLGSCSFFWVPLGEDFSIVRLDGLLQH